MLFNIFYKWFVLYSRWYLPLYNYADDNIIGFYHTDIDILKSHPGDGSKIVLDSCDNNLWLNFTVVYVCVCVCLFNCSWWRHQMETFSALLAICAGNSPVLGEFPAPRPVTRSFDVLFYLRLNKRLSKHSWGWWFETSSCPLWRHSNVFISSIACIKPSVTIIQSPNRLLLLVCSLCDSK